MKKTKWKPLAASGLCLLLALALVLSLGGGPALAFTSLPHIEEIVSSMRSGRDSFVVLELTPKEGSGSIGYYIDGGEPCGDWAKALSTTDGPSARAAYMTSLFSDLTSAGLMSSGNSTPLTLKSAYSETYPWNTGITADTRELQLQNADGTDRFEIAQNVPGVFTNTAGDYDAHYEYTPSAGGSHIQIIEDLYSAVEPVLSGGYPLMAMVGTEPDDPQDPTDDANALTYGHFVTYAKEADGVTNRLDADGNGILIAATADDQLIYARAGADGVYMTEERDKAGNVLRDEGTGAIRYVGAAPDRFACVYDNAAPLSGERTVYWYQPVFEKFNDAETGDFPADWPEAAPLFTRTEQGVYQYYATTTEDLVLDLSVQYYVLAKDAAGLPVTGAPQTSAPLADSGAEDRLIRATAALGWYAVSANNEKYQDVGAGSGYFASSLTHYEFVGRGQGRHSFAYDPASTERFSIKYDVVYYTGGFTNNDWFLKYVFDRADPDLGGLDFIVNSVTPAQLAAQPGMVASADLIVLSAGFSPADGGELSALYSAGNDLSPALANSILTAEQAGAPIIVDSALLSAAAPNLASLAVSLRDTAKASFLDQMGKGYDGVEDSSWGEAESDADNSFVGGGILLWDRSAYFPLASGRLAAELTGSAQSGYKAPLKEISYENWLRKQQGASGSSDLLPEKLSLASLIRYVINYSGGRAITPKSSITVLELEPATDSAHLTAQEVSEWLGGSVLPEKISIHSMSTYEFIGKLEDLNETYDLIYVGSSLDGFNTNTAGNATVFNDSSMNGLVYFNIGDTFRSTYGLSGLLDRDYADKATAVLDYTGKGNLFRFSGNDLTENRMDDLKDFAAAGYPVILADDLTAPSSQSVGVSASLSWERSAGDDAVIRLTASVKTNDARYTASIRECNWYKDGQLIFTGAGNILEVVAQPGASAEYHCVVSVKNGNADITTNSVTVRSSGELTVRVGNERTSGVYVTNKYSLNIKFSKANNLKENDTVTVTPIVLRDGSAVEAQIQWQYYSDYYGWTNTRTGVSNGILSVKPNNSLGYYRYVATIDGRQYSGGSFRFSRQQNSYRYFITYSNSPEYYDGITYDADVVCTPGVDGRFTLTASLSGPDAPYDNGDFSFNWYENYSISVGSGAVFTGTARTAPVTYQCKVSHIGKAADGDVSASSFTYTVSYGEVNVSSVGQAGAGSFSTGRQVDRLRVDNSSYMFRALGDILGGENVMTVSQIDGDRTSLLKYLNLSKPRIVWTGENSFPVEYSFGGGSMAALTLSADGHYYLNYGFRIENRTDATPGATTYDALLCIDLNSDGLYTTRTEEITDVVIRGADGTLLSPDSEGRYHLRADTDYTLSRQMPNGYAGIIPWKLSIVKNGESEHIRASRIGYTRIAPLKEQVEPISILQINSSNQNYYSLDLQDQLEYSTSYQNGYYKATKNTSRGSETRYYRGLFGKLIFEVEDFDIDITTVTTDYLYNMSQAEVESYIGGFDMLIIGFADMYGNLSKNSANAVVSYAGSGKAILFTHDTTSASNVNYAVNGAYSTTSPWGYYFNTVLRNTVGLDRYGVTVGGTTFGSLLRSCTDYAQYAQTVTDLHYTMAYRPGSGGTATVPETQGFTNYFLMTQNSTRIGWPSQYLNTTSTAAYTSGRRTNQVTQVNKGQITTYPYDVNTAAFKTEGSSGSDGMTVADTHEQYYQVNLNSDKIVVWFALADGGNATNGYYMHNDVTNAYYIYSKGSVTYSGMGHFASGTDASSFYTGGKTTYENEAKLFVNTMIAAYRTVTESPTVMFTADASGESGIDYFFLTSEYSGETLADGLLELDPELLVGTPATRVYFKISDPNLNTGKSISLQLYYTTDMSVTEDEVTRAVSESSGQRSLASLTAGDSPTLRSTSATWYSADGNTPGTALKGGLVYYAYLPLDVLNVLSASETPAVKLFVRISASIDGAAVEGSGVDSVELRKIGLFKLN